MQFYLRYKYQLIFTISAIILIVLLSSSFLWFEKRNEAINNLATSKKFGSLVKFKSEEDYRNYLKNVPSSIYGKISASALSSGQVMDSATTGNLPTLEATKSASSSIDSFSTDSATRVSTTNNQVLGIDEPDTVKNDAKNVYLATRNYSYSGGITPMIDIAPNTIKGSTSMLAPDIISGSYGSASVKTIQAFPPESMLELSEIKKSGQILVDGNNLVIIGYQSISVYDISDPKKPVEKWNKDLTTNTSITNTRLKDDNIFVETSNYINSNTPCSIKAFTNGAETVCNQIYHPSSLVTTDTIFQVQKINVSSGNVLNSISFVGSNQNSTFYMSNDNIYIAYYISPDYFQVLSDVINANPDVFSQTIIDRIKYIDSLDISNDSKLVEIQNEINKFSQAKNSNEQSDFYNKMEKIVATYIDTNIRQLNQTGIVKINTNNLQIEATGQIPGQLLNQFSLDEYNGNLRAAVTVGSLGFSSTEKSVNDVYVLDSNLQKIGQVLDMGKGEKIYSTRFIESQAYIVTFKQTDPFYILDLSNPVNPQLKGELKIPGYSAYLHPLSSTVIAGIGMENNKLKLTLFDVTNPSSPTELDTYNLDEYGSEAIYDHHAFLNDSKHQVMFVPGYNKSYIIDYSGNKLTMKKTLDNSSYKRAFYLDNYLYLVGGNNIQVLDETTWIEAKNFTFSGGTVQ